MKRVFLLLIICLFMANELSNYVKYIMFKGYEVDQEFVEENFENYEAFFGKIAVCGSECMESDCNKSYCGLSDISREFTIDFYHGKMYEFRLGEGFVKFKFKNNAGVRPYTFTYLYVYDNSKIDLGKYEKYKVNTNRYLLNSRGYSFMLTEIIPYFSYRRRSINKTINGWFELKGFDPDGLELP